MDQEKLQEWKQTLLREIKDLETQLSPLETEIRVRQEKRTIPLPAKLVQLMMNILKIV